MLFFIAQPIVWAWRSVITSVTWVSAPLLTSISVPSSGVSSTSRFRSTTRVVARLRPKLVY